MDRNKYLYTCKYVRIYGAMAAATTGLFSFSVSFVNLLKMKEENRYVSPHIHWRL